MLGFRGGVYGVGEDVEKETWTVYLNGILCDHYFWVSSDSQIKYI